MKKQIIAVFSALCLAAACPCVSAAAENRICEDTQSIKTQDITLRDPFVLVHDGKYYMYGTGAARGNGYGCYYSDNLSDWSGPVNVFSADESFDGVGNFWAPECHRYGDSFYLFATYLSKSTGHRGTSVFMADSPLGPFTEISDGHATPHERDSIDGTLYVDSGGQPWMVYVDEWTSSPDEKGAIDAAKLSEDLSHFISEPVELFRAEDAPWSDGKVTDGPFLYRTSGGKLLMTWSSFNKFGYCVGLAKAVNGTVDSKWTHKCTPIYRKDTVNSFDGGHSMLFTDLDGHLIMCAHSPNGNEQQHTHPIFLQVTDTGRTIVLNDTAAAKCNAFKSFDSFSAYLKDSFKLFFMLIKYAFAG